MTKTMTMATHSVDATHVHCCGEGSPRRSSYRNCSNRLINGHGLFALASPKFEMHVSGA